MAHSGRERLAGHLVTLKRQIAEERPGQEPTPGLVIYRASGAEG